MFYLPTEASTVSCFARTRPAFKTLSSCQDKNFSLLSLVHPQALTSYKSWTAYTTSNTHPRSMNYTASCYLQPMLKDYYVMVTHLELHICMNCKLVFQKLYCYTYALTIYVFRRILPGFLILCFAFSLLSH